MQKVWFTLILFFKSVYKKKPVAIRLLNKWKLLNVCIHSESNPDIFTKNDIYIFITNAVYKINDYVIWW